jgi:hypothetical protein
MFSFASRTCDWGIDITRYDDITRYHIIAMCCSKYPTCLQNIIYVLIQMAAYCLHPNFQSRLFLIQKYPLL